MNRRSVMNTQGSMTYAQRYALTGALFGLVFPVLATLLQVLDAGLPLSISSMVAVQSGDPLLWIIDTAPVFLSIFAAIGGRKQDNLERANRTLKARERELETAQLLLEERVYGRTQELTSLNQQVRESAEQLKRVADTTRSLMAVQDPAVLFPLIVREISRQFEYHHVGIYLLDEQKQHAVLVASSSEAGSGIHTPGEHLTMNEQSPVEMAIRSGQVRILDDKEAETALPPGYGLPGTRSRLILPLKSGDSVLGVLDLQSDGASAYGEEYVSILSILADQVTIAIQNAILHEKTQRMLREIEAGSRQSSAREWGGWMESIRSRGYRYDGIRSEPWQEADPASSSQKRIQRIPLRLRGRTIGSLKISLSETSQSWTDDDHAIAEATAERAALALEGARLLDEAKKRAARETFLSDVAAKLGTSFQLDSILRDTVEELGQTLEGSTVSFQLINPASPPVLKSGKTGKLPAEQNHSENEAS